MYIIKSGALYSVDDGKLTEFQSPFAEDFYNQAARSYQLDSWKHTEDKPDQLTDLSMMPRNMIWGGRKATPPARVNFEAVFATPGRLYYILQMSNSRGLFYFDQTTNQEVRIFHRAEFQPKGLFIDADGSILTTIEDSDGSTHLVQYDENGKREQILTSGDCRDEAPCRAGNHIYYQSTGFARNAAGVIVAQSPSAIHRLDTQTGDIDTVIEDQKWDYLLPRVSHDGVLYCIKAPYQRAYTLDVKTVLLDIILFPWRLVVAIFGFLNAFSMFFGKKPLMTAGGANPRQVNIAGRIMHNRLVNLERTWQSERRKVAVSRDWKLIRCVNGSVTEVASNVLWFDLNTDGSPVYTDGYSVFDGAGEREFQAEDLLSCIASGTKPETIPAK